MIRTRAYLDLAIFGPMWLLSRQVCEWLPEERNMSQRDKLGPCLSPGDKVIIRANPHDSRAENVLGTVKAVRAAAGHGGDDLIDVCYPGRDGKPVTLCFGRGCLALATRGAVIKLAEQLEAAARALRREVRNLPR
jgi:hypothetical protein